MSEIMCELCFPDWKERFTIKGYALCETDQKEYVLLDGMGHRDYEIITYKHKPHPDPLGNLTDGQLDKLVDDDPRWKKSDDWLNHAMEYTYDTTFSGGWEFINDMISWGYNPKEDGHVELWLFHQLGIIEKDQVVLPLLNEIDATFTALIDETAEPKVIAKKAIELHRQMMKLRKQVETPAQIEKWATIAKRIMREGFEIASEEDT